MATGRHRNRVRQAPASIVYLTNEYELADFGVAGMGFADKSPEGNRAEYPAGYSRRWRRRASRVYGGAYHKGSHLRLGAYASAGWIARVRT